MVFAANYPWAIVYPAHHTNFYPWQTHNGGVKAKHKAFFIHTPEEDADNYPGTPVWFATYHANPNQRGSTYYFVSYQLDERRPGFTKVYQCVHEDDGAIANGLTPGKPIPSWSDGSSLNWQTDSVEVEGRAATIHQTLRVGPKGEAQWRSLIDLIMWCAYTHGYPMDREHIMGHYQVSVDRSDPGPQFPWDALIADLNGGDSVMIPFNGMSNWYADPNHQTFVGTRGINATMDFRVPSEAVAVELEVFTYSGAVKIMCGDEGVPNPMYAFQIEGPGQGYMHGRVQLSQLGASQERWCHLESVAGVTLRGVGIVGYYTR